MQGMSSVEFIGVQVSYKSRINEQQVRLMGVARLVTFV